MDTSTLTPAPGTSLRPTGHKEPPFALQALAPDPYPGVQRRNHYSIIFIREGSGHLHADVSEYPLAPGMVLFFSPYQPFCIREASGVRGLALHFHSDFYCIHKHQQEVACNGILFNNIYKPPFIRISAEEAASLLGITESLQRELEQPGLAQQELLVSYLKILLVHCSRIKVRQQQEPAIPPAPEPPLLQQLTEAIEQHYRRKHSPADYAGLLHITPKALARIAKLHYRKTLSSLIGERIVIEAKRELYLSDKPVKAIAWELGFDDEYYFSRFFKKVTSISPQQYRSTVGFAKG